MVTELDEYRAAYKPCREAVDWCVENKVTSLADAWDRVPPEWLIWMATRPGVLSDRELRLFACWCCRQIWHLMTDERSRNAVETAERYARGDATKEELAAAWSAAGDAACDAAMDAARDAAWSAAYDVARAAAYDAARDAARAASYDAQAEYLRSRGNPYRSQTQEGNMHDGWKPSGCDDSMEDSNWPGVELICILLAVLLVGLCIGRLSAKYFPVAAEVHDDRR